MDAEHPARLRETRSSTEHSATKREARLRDLDVTSRELLEYQLRALEQTPRPRDGQADPDIIPSQSPLEMAREVAALPAAQLLYESGDFAVAVLRQQQAPYVVLEIGRLREITFRAVGEGTGRMVDLDDYDTFYQHLVVWNRRERQVLGSYRLAMTDVVCRRAGPAGLYTRSLFAYDERLLERLGPAIELGRSFVRAECQRSSRVLAMLWKGIGGIVARRPRHFNLFGPVSISARYTEASRQLLAHALSRGEFRHPAAELVEPLRPPPTDRLPEFSGELTLQELGERVSRLEPDGKSLPTLVREYAKLSGRFLSFSIDPDFGSAMDGLVAVDLRRTHPRLLAAYMGPDSFARFRRATTGQTP